MNGPDAKGKEKIYIFFWTIFDAMHSRRCVS